MVSLYRSSFSILLLSLCLSGCISRISTGEGNVTASRQPAANLSVPTPAAPPTPKLPNLQAEILDDRNKTTNSTIGSFDFRNYTYELPRGWQNPDGTTEITLVNGHIKPIEGNSFRDDMTNEERVEARAQRRIGLSYVTTKYMDVNADGEDEAVVILKIETGGSAVPQVVYMFRWNAGKPELTWTIRTGDRADGGLKDIRVENGLLVVELYGQDRFILGGFETGKITGDEEQLCCPVYYSRSFYKWNGGAFIMQGKRLTFSLSDRNALPQENLGDKMNAQANTKKAKG